MKDSGIGREGPRYAIRDMTEERLVLFKLWADDVPSAHGSPEGEGRCNRTVPRQTERHGAISLEREEGYLRFDFFQERDDPTLFLLIEIYADDAALEAHRKSPHYLAFHEDVRDWVVDRKWWFWKPGRQNPHQDSLS